MKLKTLKKEIVKMDPAVKEGSRDFNAYLVLLSSANVGGNVKRVAKFAKLPRKTVAEFGVHLRKSGVWTRRGKVAHSGWFDKKSGGIGIALDAAIALGYIQRRP